MHGTGAWMGAMAPHCLGSTVALLSGRSYKPSEVVDVVDRTRAGLLIVVGDVFVRPLLIELDRRNADLTPPDLSCLRIVASSGVMLSAESKVRLLGHVPDVTILDLLGSSQGGMGGSVTNAASPVTTASFRLNPGVGVVRDGFIDVVSGLGEVGAIVLTGIVIPTGYYKDPEKTAATFRVVDGVRYSMPGDMAMVEADGTIHLLGRGSGCINTGGAKVFPEEVEEALKHHEAVEDCLVLGLDDVRYRQTVTAVAAIASGRERPMADDLTEFAKFQIAGYKVPRRILIGDEVRRAPNGKATPGPERSFQSKTMRPRRTRRPAEPSDRKHAAGSERSAACSQFSVSSARPRGGPFEQCADGCGNRTADRAAPARTYFA